MAHFITDDQWYGWDGNESELKNLRKRILLLFVLNVLLSLVCGVVPTGVTRHSWVGFAATAAVIALLAEGIAACRFMRAKSMLDKRTFEEIHQMMRWAPQCHMLLMAAAFLAGLVSCVTAFTGFADLLVLLGFAGCFACSLLIFRMYRTVKTHHVKSI